MNSILGYVGQGLGVQNIAFTKQAPEVIQGLV